uniref:Secreted protein n=1 Tax=Ascaris lumbricoides TaxID=6252 RepID=A0A0M3IMQ6_ASCLU
MTTSVLFMRVIACMLVLHFQPLFASKSPLRPVPKYPGVYESDEDEKNYYIIMKPKVVCSTCESKEDKYENPFSFFKRCGKMARGARVPEYPVKFDHLSIKNIYNEMTKDLRAGWSG